MKPEIKIQDLLPPTPIWGSAGDLSVEYAIAYALRKAGVKTLSFGSFGPPDRKQVLFNSITAKPYVQCGSEPVLGAVLHHFGLRYGGGASAENPSYMQASFLYKATKPHYVKGRYIKSTSEGELLSRVFAIFHWLKDEKSRPQ